MQRKSRKERKAKGKEKGKARRSLAQVSRLQQKGKARHQNPGTSQDSADLSTMSQKMNGGDIGQQIGPPATVGAAPMVEALGVHGMVPLGKDGEQCYHMFSWYRVSDHMITYSVHRTSNEFVL